MQGRRLPDDTDVLELKPGDYALIETASGRRWMACTPTGVLTKLNGNTVSVHPNGTISATVHARSEKGNWFGTIVHGMWKESS